MTEEAEREWFPCRVLEYSATFAQSIGAASRTARNKLLAEYGKAILLDYSYRHFYGDGYGKDFRVLNLEHGREVHAQELLLGGPHPQGVDRLETLYVTAQLGEAV